jgi:hypothetical protein
MRSNLKWLPGLLLIAAVGIALAILPAPQRDVKVTPVSAPAPVEEPEAPSASGSVEASPPIVEHPLPRKRPVIKKVKPKKIVKKVKRKKEIRPLKKFEAPRREKVRKPARTQPARAELPQQSAPQWSFPWFSVDQKGTQRW